MAICDDVSADAKAAGAVNTLSFVDGKIYGDNTDGRGLVSDLLNHNVTLSGARILVLGAGGACRGVILPLLAHQPECLVIANRTLSKAQQLVEHFANEKLMAIDYNTTRQYQFDLIINATSASLTSSLPAIPCAVVNDSICYDMVYGAEPTAFLSWCTHNGAKQTIDGLGMLVGQAAESFCIWRGVKPNSTPVINKLRREFQGEA